MAGPDYTTLLQDIQKALNDKGEGKTVSQLVGEVRDAIQGSGAETVGGYLRELRQTMIDGFQRLINEIHNMPAGGGGRGGTPSHADPTNSASPENQLYKKFDEIGEKLERVLIAFEEGGGGGHGGTNDYFGRQVYLKTLRDTGDLFDKLYKGVLKISDVTDHFQNLKTAQLNANFEELVNRVMNVGLHATNLGLAFQNLHQTIRENVSGFRENIFGSNVLGTGQYFFEFFNRLKEGVLADSDSFRISLKTVRESIDQGFASPLVTTGKSLAELSTDFNLARQSIGKMMPGGDLRAFGTTAQTERWMVDMVDTLHKMGIHATIHDPITESMVAQQSTWLAKIAANTGMSVDQLEKIYKKAIDEQQSLVGLGQLTQQESIQLANVKLELGKYGDISGLNEVMGKLLRGGLPGSPNWTPATDPKFYSLLQGSALQALENLGKASLAGNADATKAALSQFAQATDYIRQQVRENRYVAEQRYGPELLGTIGKLWTLNNQIQTAGPQTAAQKENEKPDPFAAGLEHLYSIYENQIRPLLMGLDGGFGRLTAALVFNTGAIIALTGKIGGIGGWGNIGGGGLLGTVGRVVGRGIVGAGVGEGMNLVSPPQTTGGNIGGVVGGIAGGVLGARFGTIGTMIGSSLLSYVGQKIGDFFVTPAAAAVTKATEQAKPPSIPTHEDLMRIAPNAPMQIPKELMNLVGMTPAAAAPAVAPPTSVAGPDMAAIAGFVDVQRSYQDQQIQYLSSLLTASSEGNDILGQMYSELARQTGYLTGSPSTASTPYMGRGLSVNVGAAANAGRPDNSTPYGGPGY